MIVRNAQFEIEGRVWEPDNPQARESVLEWVGDKVVSTTDLTVTISSSGVRIEGEQTVTVQPGWTILLWPEDDAFTVSAPGALARMCVVDG